MSIAMDELARIAHALYDAPDFDGTVARLLECSVGALGCDGAALILVRRNQYETAAGSDPLTEKMGRLEVDYREGPALAAVKDQQTQVVHDSGTEERWPLWSAAVAEAGLASTLTVRLWTSRGSLGALNLYDGKPGRFDSETRAAAEVLGRHASLAVASRREEATLWEAVDARKKVGQAIGILMERYQLDERRAFEVLRRYSQANNLRLSDVAGNLITTGDLPA